MSLPEKSFNWEHVRRRLREGQVAAETSSRDRERMEVVYRERAARLALRRAEADTSATFGALVFTLGPERYAIELEDLIEVLPCSGYTEVPGAPQALLGVINLRGDVRPVLDLARVLELPKVADGDAGFLLLLRKQNREVALKVDQVEKIRMFRPSELVDQGQNGTHLAVRYLKAVTSDTVMLLSTEALLSLSIIKESS
jgi:purine-binding chemotaxis protein CheW